MIEIKYYGINFTLESSIRNNGAVKGVFFATIPQLVRSGENEFCVLILVFCFFVKKIVEITNN